MVPAATISIDPAAILPPVRPRPRLVFASNRAQMDVGERLDRQCVEMAGKFTGSRAITLTCAAAHERLPRGTGTQLALIAAELVASAFSAFERRQDGRIAVSFEVGARSMTLTVEHSRPTPRAASCQGVTHSWLARTLVARLAGRLEAAFVIGGSRTVVTVPRA